MYRFKNFGYRLAMRIFVPDLARNMQAEGMLDLPREGDAPNTDYMKVEDNGADITIWSFSGLDVLYAGLPRFEFQRVLRSLGIKANFVFLRDMQRMAFQLKPDGTPGGPDFYAADIRKTMAQLGAKRNIGIGSSIGAGAALAFGTAAGMDELILFGAVFNFDGFSAPGMVRKTLFDGRKLFTEPRAYAEQLVVALAARWARKNFAKRLGVENVMRPVDMYRDAEHQPSITLIYGETSHADVAQALLLGEQPRVRLVPLPTGRHNAPGFLKARGQLALCLAEALA